MRFENKKDEILTEIGEGILLGTCNNDYGPSMFAGALYNLDLITEEEHDNDSFDDMFEAWESDLAEKLAELEIQECPECGWWCSDVHNESDNDELICGDCVE